jgi:hypothetical protein
MKFFFKEGSRLRGDPEVVGKELERIRKSAGRLTAKIVVAAAEDRASPLHSLFEWDNRKAASRYRLAQAMRLIRTIIVVVDNKPARHQYLLVGGGKGNGRRYEPIDHVLQNPDLFQSGLEMLELKLEAALRSVEELISIAKGSKQKAITKIALQGLRKVYSSMQKASA